MTTNQHSERDASAHADAEADARARTPPDDEELPDIEQFLAAMAAALLVGAIYLALPDNLTLGPSWLLLVVVALLATPGPLFVLLVGRRLPYPMARGLALALLAVLTLALAGSVALLIARITTFASGGRLLGPAVLLWACNVLVFSLWYWDIDGGGPLRRLRSRHRAWDLAFPQHQLGNPGPWLPGFVDYLFLAFNTSTALSPTDTYPLHPRIKLLMMAQSIVSLLIIALLISRSVNIL
jgi:hypothetical protein